MVLDCSATFADPSNFSGGGFFFGSFRNDFNIKIDLALAAATA